MYRYLTLYLLQSQKGFSRVESAEIDSESFDLLKNDTDFRTAITHSTSHVDSVKNRLSLARKYLYGIVDNELSGVREDGK